MTLHVKDAAAKDVFDQLMKQTGVQFAPFPPNLLTDETLKPLSLDAEQKPFWEVLREVSAATGVFPQHHGMNPPGKVALSKFNDPWGKRPIFSAAQFMVAADMAGRSKTIDYSGDRPVDDIVTLSLIVFLDPKLRLAGMTLQLDQAADENGLSLVPKNAAQTRQTMMFNGLIAAGRVVLARPGQAGTKIKLLKVAAHLRTVTKIETWEIQDVLHAQPATKTFGDTTYTFKKITKTPRGYEVEITTKQVGDEKKTGRREGSAAIQFATTWSHLTDDQGRPYRVAGQFTRPNAAPGVPVRLDAGPLEMSTTITYEAALGEPDSFTFDAPVEIKDSTVPIDFQDLALP